MTKKKNVVLKMSEKFSSTRQFLFTSVHEETPSKVGDTDLFMLKYICQTSLRLTTYYGN
jgi:hypothetical protein